MYAFPGFSILSYLVTISLQVLNINSTYIFHDIIYKFLTFLILSYLVWFYSFLAINPLHWIGLMTGHVVPMSIWSRQDTSLWTNTKVGKSRKEIKFFHLNQKQNENICFSALASKSGWIKKIQLIYYDKKH